MRVGNVLFNPDLHVGGPEPGGAAANPDGWQFSCLDQTAHGTGGDAAHCIARFFQTPK
jgi:hypothetical protein